MILVHIAFLSNKGSCEFALIFKVATVETQKFEVIRTRGSISNDQWFRRCKKIYQTYVLGA